MVLLQIGGTPLWIEILLVSLLVIAPVYTAYKLYQGVQAFQEGRTQN